jgi:HAD superfamily hydrolase (TIGR01509 family)
VVFDFDGVIVDSHPAHVRAWGNFLNSEGMAVPGEQMQFILDGRKREEILRHFMGELSEEQISEYGRRKEKFFREEARHIRTIKGLLAFLEDLAREHLAVAIASSGSRGRIDFLLEKLDLKKTFRVVVTGDDVQQGKPHPALFLKTARQLELGCSQLVVFEDAISGVRAARSAGMACVGVAPASKVSLLMDAGANCVVPDFASLSCAKLREMCALRNGVEAAF